LKALVTHTATQAAASQQSRLAWLFLATVGALLVPVWANAYFFNGDGPCHLYNARVLLDLWQDKATAFYGDYYLLNRLLVPNYFSHVLLAGLLALFPAATAEKVLWTIYIISYAYGTRWLLRGIRPGAEFLAFLVLPLVVSKVSVMGFYNYSFSIVALLWLTGAWLRWRPDIGVVAGFALGLLVTYLMHPLGLLLTLLSMGVCSVVRALVARPPGSPWQAVSAQLLREFLAIGLAAAPALALFGAYLLQIAGASTPNNTPAGELWRSLKSMELLAALVPGELPWYAALARLIAGLSLGALGWRMATQRRSLQLEPADAFWLLSALALYLYFAAPEGAAGGSILSVRLQVLPYLFLVCALASRPWPRWAQVAIVASGVVLTVGLLIVRWPTHRMGSLAVTEYASAGRYIAPYSTVLAMSYHHAGQWPGTPTLSPLLWWFMHAADYIGAEHPPLVMLANYEANTGTFPLRWRDNRNPFWYLSADPGLESMPPGVDLAKYRQQGGRIDYILLWAAADHFTDHPASIALRAELARDYRLRYRSAHGYAELYESRTRHGDAW
jgi:hypothetical protein